MIGSSRVTDHQNGGLAGSSSTTSSGSGVAAAGVSTRCQRPRRSGHHSVHPNGSSRSCAIDRRDHSPTPSKGGRVSMTVTVPARTVWVTWTWSCAQTGTRSAQYAWILARSDVGIATPVIVTPDPRQRPAGSRRRPTGAFRPRDAGRCVRGRPR